MFAQADSSKIAEKSKIITKNDSLPKNIKAKNGIERGLVRREMLTINKSNIKGKVVIDICIDREGTVVFAEINKIATIGITDEDTLDRCLVAAKKYKFSRNELALERECGVLTFKISTPPL